jgi:hypothetical protein
VAGILQVTEANDVPVGFSTEDEFSIVFNPAHAKDVGLK